MARYNSTSGGRFKSSSSVDLGTVQGLGRYAGKVGLQKEADGIINEEPKLSFLQRLGKGLGAFNTADAVLTANDNGLVAGVKTYATGVARGLGSAVTGNDYDPQRRSYREVAERLGIDNGIAKFGVGFLGDVLLDPTTYFGGAIAKGIGIGGKFAGGTALKTVGKIAPETEAGLRMAGTGLKDALGRAFVNGYKSSEGALDDTLKFLSRTDKAKLGLASSNLNRLGVGILDKDQQTELALKLIAGKRGEFIERTGGATAEIVNSADPLVQKSITEQSARSQKFAKQLGLEDPYETYFPFIKKDKLDNFTKSLSAKNVKVGSEQYLKKFKNILTNDAIETNPAKAFFTSEAQQVTDRMTKDFLGGFAKQYGKDLSSFKNLDEARGAGYELLREKGMFGKEVGYISKYDSHLLNNLITPEFQSVSMLAKATGYDALTNLFKRSVTGLFLPFHVRNYVSGTIQNFEALGVRALSPMSIMSGQKFALHLAKGTTPKGMEKIFTPFAERFGTDTFYQSEFLNAVEHGTSLKSAEKVFSKGALRSTLGFQKGNIVPLLGNDATPFKLARVVGQFTEHQQKATAYITALSKGETVKNALKLAERAGFDYRNLTAFESQILRRIVPFYSFTRKNIELQLKTLGEHPERINQVLAVFNNIGTRPSEEEKKSLPQYIKDSIGVKLEDLPNGIKQYISSFGTPIEAFTSLLNGNPVLMAISQTNPILKAPIELGIGKDSFRQKDLKDVYDASEYKGMPKVLKDLLEIKEVKKDVLQKLPNGKLKKTGERIQYVADPAKLLIARSLFTSRGVSYFDQVFGGDLHGFTKFLKTTTGIKPQQVDIGLQESLKESKQKRELEDLLKKYGEAAIYQKAYVPKN